MESVDHEFHVRAIGSNEEIDVRCETSISVPRDGKRADNKKFNSGRVQ